MSAEVALARFCKQTKHFKWPPNMEFIFKVLEKGEGLHPKPLFRFTACCFLHGNGASRQDIISIVGQLFPSEGVERKIETILDKFGSTPWKFHYFNLKKGQRMTMDGKPMTEITGDKNKKVRKVNAWSDYCFSKTTSFMIEQRELSLESALDPELLEMLADASSV